MLPPLVADQIAAGEVVERPASVVKELLENALDAGATRIEVELAQGGIELIRITDDGAGIPPDELPLALAAHATSKLRDAEELARIGTLGFRGEALASITSVARVRIRSVAPGHEPSEIEGAGDQRSAVRPAAVARGTSIEVRTLFFNTPARRRFLRTPATEQTRCMEVVRDLALAHPAVALRALCDGRETLDLRAEQGPRARALAILGRELEDNLVEVHADEQHDARGVSLWGLVGTPAVARSNARAQRVFVNGRAVRDPSIQHALREAYRGLIEPGRYPTAVLMIDLPPDGVDVNVHPAKAEVRFRDQGMVHSLVLNTVREALRRADLTPTLAHRTGARPAIFGPGDGPTDTASDAQSFADYFRRDLPASTGGRFDYQAVRDALDRVLTMGSKVEPAGDASDERERPDPASPEAAPATPASQLEALPRRDHLQVHQSYVVAQDDDGVVIVDQHALHERAMFEALHARITAGPLESQSLLTPAVVDTSSERVTRLEELTPLLERLGIDAAALSPSTVGVRAFPTLLFSRGVDPIDFMSELLDRADADAFVPDSEEALREVLDMMACKAAVKAGDRLTDAEIGALLELRGSVERSTSCPHGRPTSVRLTLADLERLFERR